MARRRSAKAIVAWAQEQADIPDVTAMMPLVKDVELGEQARKVLAALLLPKACALTSKSLSELTGVSGRYIRQLQADPKFNRICAEKGKELIGCYALQLLHSYIRDALSGQDKVARENLLTQAAILDKKDAQVPLIQFIQQNFGAIQQDMQKQAEQAGERFGHRLPAIPVDGVEE